MSPALVARLRTSCLVTLVLLALAASALAHAGSIAFWRVEPGTPSTRSDILLSLDDVGPLEPGLPRTEGDVPLERLGVLRDLVTRHFLVVEDGVPAPSRVIAAHVRSSGLLELRIEHDTHRGGALSMRSTFHRLTDDGHRVVVRVGRDQTSQSAVLTVDGPEFAVPQALVSHDAGPVAMIRLGIAHILTGYDHLIFLACLLVPGGSWRSRVAIVSVFTLAHSLTLVLTALGVVAPPARFVEPAIALSIAYVAIENLLDSRPWALVRRRRPWFPFRGPRPWLPFRSRRPWSTVSDLPGARPDAARWPMVFVFGLIHGLGFAGGLGVLDLPVRQWLVSVLSFNFGVEIGQLAIVAVAVPCIAWLASSRWHQRVVQSTSVLVLGLAVVWFVERLS